MVFYFDVFTTRYYLIYKKLSIFGELEF